MQTNNDGRGGRKVVGERLNNLPPAVEELRMHTPCQTDRFWREPKRLSGISRPNWPSMMKAPVPIHWHSNAASRLNPCSSYKSAPNLASVASCAIASLGETNCCSLSIQRNKPRRCPASPTLLISPAQTEHAPDSRGRCFVSCRLIT